MDETIARYGILVFPPGAVYQYCNLGYGIIDHIITRLEDTRKNLELFKNMSFSQAIRFTFSKLRKQLS